MFKDDLLAGKVALVTGGGSGLGLTMTRKYLDLGARVAIIGRNLERLQTAEEQLHAGERLSIHACDVREADQVERAIGEVYDVHSTVDIVVNNAAGNFLAATEDLSPNAFDAVVRTVLHGTFNVTSVTGRRMIEAKCKGVFLNIITTYAWTGSAFVVPSAVSKAGVLALTRSLAVEWAAYGIRLNAIAPGPFPTEGAWSRLLPTPELEKESLSRIPMGRFGEHEEFANLAAFLVSDAAPYINGDCITIDGGAWLASGGLFNGLTRVPREQVKDVLRTFRRKS
jgi:NAD(P)-dependent dehydrogenase (short-subunit alcohol dehydrogenase family)